MRNFTLGKNGIPLFFFALFFMIGTYSYGQENCPTVADTTQEYCYLSTVADLEATANGDEVRFYRTATSTNPIPANELLQDGSYFAGNASGTCTQRTEINVTVINAGPPTSLFGVTFQPCEYDQNDTSTVADLIALIDGNEVQIFDEEFSETPLDPNTVLVDEQNYFAGQRSSADCPTSSRLALRYDPILALAPTAEAVQTFCQGATVADLEAQATSPNTQAFRWYSTLSSNPALAPSTPLIDGEKYYVSQIINRTNSPLPPCESMDRFEVTVILEAGINELGTQAFCESFSTPEEEFDVPRVEDLSPAGPWYAEAESTEILDSQTELVDGEDYFSRNNTEQCAQDRVVVDIFPTPNAGKTTQVTFCENEASVNLVEYMEPSILGKPDPDGNGFFRPALSTGTKIFNPADYAPGEYNFTYVVPGNDDCPTDEAEITVTVEAAPNAGADVSETVCFSELENSQALAAEFAGLLDNRDPGGTFDNPATQETIETYTLEQYAFEVLLPQSAPNPNQTRTYSAIYRVENEQGCVDSATLSLQVLESPDAGESVVIDLEERDDSLINLFDELGGTPTAGGTFTNEAGVVVDATFDPASDEAGVFTYTVTNTTTGCTDTATVTILPAQNCPEVTETNQSFCESIGDGNNFRIPNVSDLNPTTAVWYATADSTEPLAPETNLIDGENYFAGNAEGTCENRTEVIVDIVNAPNAGSTTFLTVCSNDAPFDFVDVFEPSILGPADPGGTVSPALASGSTIFDPSVDTAGEYIYTVSTGTYCEDDRASITITINQAPDAGQSVTVDLAERDDSVIDLFAELEGTPELDGTWTPGDGTFNPATDELGTFTYTVTAPNGCDASATVTVIDSTLPVCPEVTDTVQGFCASIGTGDAFRRPRVSDLLPTDAIWYATADGTDALAPTTQLIDGEDYFAGNVDATCPERDMVTVQIYTTPNAGKTSQTTFCANDEPVNLVDRIQPSILGAPSQDGYFTRNNQRVLENNTFDPSEFEAGTYKFTYVVPGNEDCPRDTSVITVTVKPAPNAGADINEDFCVADVSEILDSQQEFLDLFADDSRTTGGTFNPSLETLAAQFANDPYQNFSTTYSVTSGGCTDTANLSVTITQEVPADAGDNMAVTFCSTEGVQNLYDFLSADANPNGVFEAPYADGTFDPSTAGTDPIEITYTVAEDNACVTGTDTSVITVTVIEGPDAGEDTTITLDVNAEPVDLLTEFDGTPEAGGTFTPAVENGILDPSTLSVGTYTFTYTVVSANGCEASAVLTVIIEGEVLECPEVTDTEQVFCETIDTGNNSRRPRVSDLQPSNAVWYATADSDAALAPDTILENGAVYFAGNADATCGERDSVTVILDDSPNAGATTAVTLCENADPVDLVTLMRESVLGAPDAGGTFSPALASGTTIFDPSVDAAGKYTYRVESSNDACPADIAVITITITEATTAGPDVDLTFCSTEGPQNLYDFIPEGTPETGTFEGLTDGEFDPSANEAGEYTFQYTFTSSGSCAATTSATYTIVVENAPDAPTVTDFTACVVEAATVADLDITAEDGATITVYSDETLQTEVADTDVLADGMYYVTQTNATGCESDAAVITVTLSDSEAPTLSQDGNVFCEFDNATVADLEENITEEGDITWYTTATGTETFNASDVLVNGTTYYAALTPTDECESSERLAVTVTLEVCEIIIPEAFSPNGDQINDQFVVDNLASEYPNFTMEIYNRWGEPVYKGGASTPAWDGTSTEGSFGSGVLPAGVYFYILYFNDGQTAPTQGRVYLSR